MPNMPTMHQPRPRARSASPAVHPRDRQSPFTSTVPLPDSPGSPNMLGLRSPPSYARSSLDRSPSTNPMVLGGSPRVPPPIYLRSSSPQGVSSRGELKLHIPAWGVVFVQPPKQTDTQMSEHGGLTIQPPVNDTLLSGSLEVTMRERRRCRSISIGVQSVCKLHMGDTRGWEEDGIFERGVEVLGGDAEGIWLEKGSQSFSFSILLPATLATHDRHAYGRVSYILTARVEGIPNSSALGGIFKTKTENVHGTDIPFKADFEVVIARSDRLAQGLTRNDSVSSSPQGHQSPGNLSPRLRELAISDSPFDDSVIAVGEGSPSLGGLYHRSLSSDIQQIPSLTLPGLCIADDCQSIRSVQSMGSDGVRTEKAGWLKGDLNTARSLIIHANPNPTGGVTELDVRKAGSVNGLGSWRFSATSDVFSISAVLMLSISIPAPSPAVTIFFTRLLLVQSYALHSPRTPNDPPLKPEQPRNFVLYQVGRPHKAGERHPPHDVDSLWRGKQAGGHGVLEGEEGGWRTRAVARLPNHDKIRPSTNDGTITPIRVSHELVLQVFYSIEGMGVYDELIHGPGELRMMGVKVPVIVPSCCCSMNALNLPTYERAGEEPFPDIDAIIDLPLPAKHCQCGFTFAELGEAAMRRMQEHEAEEAEARERERTQGAGGAGSPGTRTPETPENEGESRKIEMERRGSGSGSWRG